MRKFNDILTLTRATFNYNLHSHTEFCDGHAQMEAFAREAVKENFILYGFTPHSPIPFHSPCNMLQRNLPRYFAEADRISRLHPECTFVKGMEIDYLGKDWNASIPFFQDMPLDYSISSVHFIPAPDGRMIDIDGSNESFAKKLADDFGGDLDYIIKTFFANSLEMVETGGFDIVGHFDKIADNATFIKEGIEQEDWFIDLCNSLISLIAEKSLAVEINTKKFTAKNRFFPALHLWKRVLELEIPILINSDAHVPALINSGRNEARQLLETL